MEDTQRIDMTLEPLDEYLVVQPVSDETETRAGLILAAGPWLLTTSPRAR